MGNNIDYSKRKWMESADVKSNELKKSRERKMHGAAKNAGKFSQIFIPQKTGDIIRNKSISKRVGINNKNQSGEKKQDEPVFIKKIEEAEGRSGSARSYFDLKFSFEKSFVFFPRPFLLEIFQNIIFRNLDVRRYFRQRNFSELFLYVLFLPVIERHKFQ